MHHDARERGISHWCDQETVGPWCQIGSTARGCYADGTRWVRGLAANLKRYRVGGRAPGEHVVCHEPWQWKPTGWEGGCPTLKILLLWTQPRSESSLLRCMEDTIFCTPLSHGICLCYAGPRKVQQSGECTIAYPLTTIYNLLYFVLYI